MDDTLKAMASQTRREILQLVRDCERPSGQIAANFPSISRPAVCQHLRVLEEVGLVRVRREGNRRLYSWRRDGLREAAEFIDDMWADRLQKLRLAAELEASRVDDTDHDDEGTDR